MAMSIVSVLFILTVWEFVTVLSYGRVSKRNPFHQNWNTSQELKDKFTPYVLGFLKFLAYTALCIGLLLNLPHMIIYPHPVIPTVQNIVTATVIIVIFALDSILDARIIKRLANISIFKSTNFYLLKKALLFIATALYVISVIYILPQLLSVIPTNR